MEKEYLKRGIMNRVGARWLSLNLAREEYNKLEISWNVLGKDKNGES